MFYIAATLFRYFRKFELHEKQFHTKVYRYSLVIAKSERLKITIFIAEYCDLCLIGDLL